MIESKARLGHMRSRSVHTSMFLRQSAPHPVNHHHQSTTTTIAFPPRARAR
jgi:hypothetical protein